jgi:hypothetical protein
MRLLISGTSAGAATQFSDQYSAQNNNMATLAGFPVPIGPSYNSRLTSATTENIVDLNWFVLVGFAYLFVTSARYSWSSIGNTFMLVATCILVAYVLLFLFVVILTHARLRADRFGWASGSRAACPAARLHRATSL